MLSNSAIVAMIDMIIACSTKARTYRCGYEAYNSGVNDLITTLEKDKNRAVTDMLKMIRSCANHITGDEEAYDSYGIGLRKVAAFVKSSPHDHASSQGTYSEQHTDSAMTYMSKI
jgi:hypothetical protein